MNTVFNYNELKGKIISKYGNQKNFAKVIGTNPQRVSKVLSNKAYLDNREIQKWSIALDIDVDLIPYYFFAC